MRAPEGWWSSARWADHASVNWSECVSPRPVWLWDLVVLRFIFCCYVALEGSTP